MIPGPLGGDAAPGNPPTPAKPTGPPAAQPTQQQGFESMLQNMLAPIGSGAALQNVGLGMQAGVAGGQQQLTDTQLLQQLQNTMAGLGIQGTQIGQEQAYETGQYGIGQQQLGLQRLQANQQYGQQVQGLQESGAASGTYGDYGYGQQQQALQEQHANTLAQLGLQGQQQQLGYGYQQQQIQDALKQLGLSKTEAGQTYTQGTQGAANTYQGQLAQLTGQQGGVYQGEANQVQQLLGSLLGIGYTGT